MFIRFLLFLFSTWSFLSAEVKIFSSVDDNRIALNETVNLKITAEESDEFPQLDISQIQDFTIISGPAQSSSFQWINGKMSSSKTLSWTLIPNKTGPLMIPALDIKLDGKPYQTKPITIYVVKSHTQTQNRAGQRPGAEKPETPPIFLIAEAEKDEVYLGEQITVHYRLYTRVNLRQYSVEKKPQGIGFWVEELYAPKQPSLRETRVNSVRYQVATLYKIALFPTTTGELILDPMVLNCTIDVSTRSRVPSLFDDFFSDSFFKRTKQQIVSSEQLILNVKPVPLIGKPEDYSGAVGEFIMTSFLDTTATEVNQAISYTVELSGTGNLNLFQLGEPEFPQGLEIFNPKMSFEKDPFRDDISGTKRWEYILIPRREGRFLIPQTELIYFNPTGETWLSTSTKTLTLDVRPGQTVRSQGLTKEEIILLGQDIRYIRSSPVKLRSLRQQMVPKLFWWFSIFGIFLFVSPRIIQNVLEEREEITASARSRNAFRNARKSLKKIKDFDDFDKIADAVFCYFGSKMSIPQAGMDSRFIKELLDGKVQGKLVEDLTQIISQCDHAQYAPAELSRDEKDAISLAADVTALLKEIEDQL